MTTHLCDAPATVQAAMLRTGEVSASELLEQHLERIDTVNPQVNAVVTLDVERAREAAASADSYARRADPDGLPPLHGLPVVIKDTHATQGMRTTHGSPLMRDHVPDADDLLVERIRSAGAIIIGKSNVPEFAAGSHTFNTLFGATRNPYDLSRSAGGSSGGAAAALATGMAALADGSDMGGSLRNPASFCNVVGFRPSPGRVPTVPSAAPWSTLAVQGPMGRTVEDVALLLSVMAGADGRCPISLEDDPRQFAPPLSSPRTRLRVAWSPDLGGTVPVDPEVRAALSPQVKLFEELGCEVEEACPDFSGAEDVFRTLRAWQFHLMLGSQVAAHRESFKASLAWNVDVGAALTGPDIARAETLHASLFSRVRAFFTEYDLLLLPVSQVAPFDVDLEYPASVDGEAQHTYLDWMRSAYFVSAAGNPAVSVPAAFTPAGLPVGLQIVGPHRGDLAVLRAAHAFERLSGAGRRRPSIAGIQEGS